MQTDFAVGTGKFDTPSIPAVGQPAFGNFAGRHVASWCLRPA